MLSWVGASVASLQAQPGCTNWGGAMPAACNQHATAEGSRKLINLDTVLKALAMLHSAPAHHNRACSWQCRGDCLLSKCPRRQALQHFGPQLLCCRLTGGCRS